MITSYAKNADGKLVQVNEWASWVDMALDSGYAFMVKRHGPGVISAKIFNGEKQHPRPMVYAPSVSELMRTLNEVFETTINVHDDRYLE